MAPRRRRDRDLHAELDRVALRAAADREQEMYVNAGASPTFRLFSELLSLAFSPFFFAFPAVLSKRKPQPVNKAGTFVRL